MSASRRAAGALALPALFAAALVTLLGSSSAHAQYRYQSQYSPSRYIQPYGNPSDFYASIAYSQTTGNIGFSAGKAHTKGAADVAAMTMCQSKDAKVFMWARNKWIAVAVIDGHIGTAGFGQGDTSDAAQQNALDELAKRAHNDAQRVALCVNSSGQRIPDAELRKIAGTPAKSVTGYFAALAFSPSTGKIGKTAGKATTVVEAKKLALADCREADAKVFMWGDQWIAVAVATDTPGIAGFGPGATREDAEKAALEQCTKLAKGAAARVALTLYSTGEDNPVIQPIAVDEPVAEESAAPPTAPAVQLPTTPAPAAAR